MSKKKSVEEIIQWERRFCALRLEKMCQWDFAHDNGQNPAITDKAKKYVKNFEELRKEGAGLFLFGGPGAGKSFTAAQIVNALTDRGYNCYFTSMTAIIAELNTTGFEGRRSFLNQLFERDLLVLDDLGSEMETPYCNQIFIQIVNTCLAKYIPVIVTTPYHQDVLLKDGNNSKRAMAITRLLQRNVAYPVLMPAQRRREELQKKRKTEALVNGGAVAEQQTLDEFTDAPEETAVKNCSPETAEQQELEGFKNNKGD